MAVVAFYISEFYQVPLVLSILAGYTCALWPSRNDTLGEGAGGPEKENL
jgi:hypothetical protein